MGQDPQLPMYPRDQGPSDWKCHKPCCVFVHCGEVGRSLPAAGDRAEAGTLMVGGSSRGVHAGGRGPAAVLEVGSRQQEDRKRPRTVDSVAGKSLNREGAWTSGGQASSSLQASESALGGACWKPRPEPGVLEPGCPGADVVSDCTPLTPSSWPHTQSQLLKEQGHELGRGGEPDLL